MIPTLIASVTQLFTGWINGKLEVQKSKIETEKAAEANKIRLLADQQSYNHSWEMAQLTDSDKVLRRICFAIFSYPFIHAIFDPAAVSSYFHEALNSMPEWYTKTYMGIVGGVWGLSAFKNTLTQIVGELKTTK